jgi:tetratricopeptide (TPR) repeat protein
MLTGYTPDWKRAAEIYQRLLELFPDEFENGESLLHAQISAGDAAAAFSTLAKLRERPVPPVFAVMLDNYEAKAAQLVRDFPRSQAAAARAASQAETLKDWYAAGLNRGLEADALHRQQARERAREVLRASIQLFRRSGNRLAEANAIRRQLEMLPAEDLRGRLQVAREAHALYAELNHSSGRCMTLLDIGSYEHSLGGLHAALRAMREALPLCQGTRLPGLELGSWELLGRIHRSLGELDAAESSVREQLRLARENKAGTEVVRGLTELAELWLVRGDLAQARRLHDEARQLLQEKGRRAPEDLALRQARLAFEEGHLEEASRLADTAVTSVPELDVPEVHLLRAQLFLALGHYKEANVALLEAGEPAVLMTSLGLRLQGARLRAARGSASEREAALTSLRELLARAQELGWLEGQYEARLALGEVELAAGRTAAGLARLKALERDASKSGWEAWARKASLQGARALSPQQGR